MKLCVFLFCHVLPDKVPELDKHYEYKILTHEDIPTYAHLSKLIRKEHPVVFCTTGEYESWKPLFELPHEYRRRWIHKPNLDDLISLNIENCYMNVIKPFEDSSLDCPTFSVITTTFHSGKKIFRPYQSLKDQTYRDWEWILWDDSKEDDSTWNTIKEFADEDIRIRCYRDYNHSGFIGHMKWLSSSLARGDWIVELDHDDIIDPRLFEWCIEAIHRYPDSDFIASSCVELFEDNEAPFHYGASFGLGYGCYQKEWLRGKWHNVTPVIDITPLTIRHIVGVPNHVRIWRRSFYEEIGRHNPELPVVDDYELLIRSFLHGNWVRINAPAYFQYRNSGGNNFTFLRNSLIQYLTAWMAHKYSEEIDARSLELGLKSEGNFPKIWEQKSGFSYKKFIRTYLPEINAEKAVSVLIPVEDGVTGDDLILSIISLFGQEYKRFLIYIIGNRSNTLDSAMDRIRQNFGDNVIRRIKWWNLETKNDLQITLNYFHRMLLSTKFVAYMEPGSTWDCDYLSKAINSIGEKKFWHQPGTPPTLYHLVHTDQLLHEFDSFGPSECQKVLSLN